MELPFSKYFAALRTTARDPTDRKVVIGRLLRFRRLFLWAALPLLLGLVGVVGALLSYYLMMRRGTAMPEVFPKIVDIFSAFTGSLLFLSFACLFLVKLSDTKLALLSSLRSEDELAEPPAAALTLQGKKAEYGKRQKIALPERPGRAEISLPAPPTNEVMASSLSDLPELKRAS